MPFSLQLAHRLTSCCLITQAWLDAALCWSVLALVAADDTLLGCSTSSISCWYWIVSGLHKQWCHAYLVWSIVLPAQCTHLSFQEAACSVSQQFTSTNRTKSLTAALLICRVTFMPLHVTGLHMLEPQVMLVVLACKTYTCVLVLHMEAHTTFSHTFFSTCNFFPQTFFPHTTAHSLL